MLQRLTSVKERHMNPVIIYSATRVLSAIISDFDVKTSKLEDAKILLGFLINSFSKGESSFSDYILVVSFSHVLLIPGLYSYFLSHKGCQILISIMSRNTKDLQITYYCLLCLWSLSYESDMIEWASSSSVS